MLATALAMLEVVHLLVIKRFNDRFLSFALAQALDSTLRAPLLAEILAADRSVWESVWALMRDHGWSLSDSLNEIAFCRQDFSSALQPRPRPPAPARPPPTLQPRLPGAPDAGRKRKVTLLPLRPLRELPRVKPRPTPKVAPVPRRRPSRTSGIRPGLRASTAKSFARSSGSGSARTRTAALLPPLTVVRSRTPPVTPAVRSTALSSTWRQVID